MGQGGLPCLGTPEVDLRVHRSATDGYCLPVGQRFSALIEEHALNYIRDPYSI